MAKRKPLVERVKWHSTARGGAWCMYAGTHITITDWGDCWIASLELFATQPAIDHKCKAKDMPGAKAECLAIVQREILKNADKWRD